MELITLGKIINTFGIKGELKVYSATDFPKKRFKKGNLVYLYNEETKEMVQLKVQKARINEDFIYLTFEGLNDINLVLKYKNWLIQIEKEKLHELEKDQYYHHDLIGCKVMNNDKYVGKIVGISSNSAQDLLRIEKEDGSSFLYPFLTVFLEKVDIENKIVYLKPIEGLIQ